MPNSATLPVYASGTAAEPVAVPAPDDAPAGARLPLWHKGVVVGEVLVDADLAEALGRYRWHRGARRGPVRHTREGAGGLTAIALAREVLGLAPGDPRQAGFVGDDRTDCRRSNLRVLPDQAANNQHRRSYRGASSAYRGVSWYAARQCWRATGQARGRWQHLGYFARELEAAVVSSDWRRKNLPYSREAQMPLVPADLPEDPRGG